MGGYHHHGVTMNVLFFVGVGTQFLTVATGCLLLALLGTFNVHRHGQLNTAAIILYAFTSCK